MYSEPNPTATAFELGLLDALLAGEHPYLDILRRQLAAARAVSREWNPAGEYLNFAVAASIDRVAPANFEISDVSFGLKDVPHGGGAILFIREGAIAFLETFTYDGDMPEPGSETDVRITYHRGSRNLEFLQQELNWRLKGMPPAERPSHLGPCLVVGL